MNPCRLMIPLAALTLSGCAIRFLQHKNADKLLAVDEYDKKMVITENAPSPTAEPTPPPAPAPVAKAKGRATRRGKRKAAVTPSSKAPVVKAGPTRRQPDIEDNEEFDGRRPKVDPFRVGEKVTLDITYFALIAGHVDIEVKPFATVNGEKAYHFEVNAASNSFFARVYAVEDKAVTYVNYQTMRPYNLQISLKESKQLAEARTLFDWNKLEANYWQKRITKEKGEQSKEKTWSIEGYAQNVISAAYYLRTFKLTPGKKLAFRVADEGKNIVFTGEVLRRETLTTAVGPMKTVVIQPQVTVDGIFSPIGEVLIWLTDDDRKFMVQLQTKIKIGSVVAKLRSIEKGQE